MALQLLHDHIVQDSIINKVLIMSEIGLHLSMSEENPVMLSEKKEREIALSTMKSKDMALLKEAFLLYEQGDDGAIDCDEFTQ